MTYTIVPFEPVLVDTNVLLYAFDTTQGQKHTISKDFLVQRLKQQQEVILSNQNLVEFLSVTTKNKMDYKRASALIYTIVQSRYVRVIRSSISDIASASVHAGQLRMSYWDALLAETMFENNVFTICTEDEGFRNDRRLNVINPFKKRCKN